MDKRVDRSAYEEELKNREPVRVTDADLYAETLEFGNEIATEAQKTLGANLKQSIQNGGLEEAIQYCNVNAYPLLDSIQKKYNAEIKRVSLKVRNPKDQPDSMEQQLLEAYSYNHVHDQPLEPNVQKVDNGEVLLYTKPIVIDNPLCLQCHGKLGETLDKEFYQKIKELYPDDKATGYEHGDFRGMWSIRLAKKEIIKSRFHN